MNDTYAQLCAEKGLKKTQARLAVLQALDKLSKPVDVQEILDQLGFDNQAVDQATVYRVLDILVAKGLVQQIDFRDGKYRYEFQANHHHHLVCRSCNQIQEITGDLLNVDESQVLKEKRFLIQDHALEFFGLCSKCQTI